MNFFKHLHTVNRHRFAVMRLCFKVGLYRQGLVHDLSKYSPQEFWAGVKYYQGYRSPQEKEREALGYSAAWLHHKGRNKHHFEYWTEGKRVYVEMPRKYLAEAICDRVAASKIYLGDKYNDSSALEYLENKTDKDGMNKHTYATFVYFFEYLKNHGEKMMLKELKKYVKCKTAADVAKQE